MTEELINELEREQKEQKLKHGTSKTNERTERKKGKRAFYLINYSF